MLVWMNVSCVCVSYSMLCVNVIVHLVVGDKVAPVASVGLHCGCP